MYFDGIYTYFLEFLKSEVTDLRYDLREVIFGHFSSRKLDFGHIFICFVATFNFMCQEMASSKEIFQSDLSEVTYWPP